MTNTTKLSLVALFAAGVFALYTAPTLAASTNGRPVPCKVNCGGQPDNPGDPDEPGDPYDNPFDDPEDGGPGDPGDGPGDPGDGPGDPGDGPGDPGDGPGDPGDGPGDPGNPGDPGLPDLPKDDLAQLKLCLAQLGKLPELTAQDVIGLADPSKVSLTPVCDDQSYGDAKPLLVDGGNAYGYEEEIRGNTLLRTKLAQTAYKPRDVVGIDFDADGNAILFVHRKS